ncbi:MAG: hypothetical protein WAM44_06305, partial [Chthoniobacterales bacterium]
VDRRLSGTVPDAFDLSALQAPFPKGRAVMEYAGLFPGAACCHLIGLAILQGGSPPVRWSKTGRWNQ